jgi:hypothetical protein
MGKLCSSEVPVTVAVPSRRQSAVSPSPLTAAAATQTLVIFAIRTRRNDRRAARFTTHHRLR